MHELLIADLKNLFRKHNIGVEEFATRFNEIKDTLSNPEHRIFNDPDILTSIYDVADTAIRRNLRPVSKAFNQAIFDNLKCADAQELQAMRSEPEPCKNTAKVIYTPEKGIQRALMCAIMSEQQDLHVYVIQDNLELFKDSVKCFDKHYALRLTLLYPTAQRDPPSKPDLYCRGGFRALKGGWARNGRLQDQEGVQVVRFTGNTIVAEEALGGNQSLMELLDVNTIQEIHNRAFCFCSALEELGDMPKLTTIGLGAFHGTPLANLGDMRSLETIGAHAFFNTQLTQLGDMRSLATIGDYAFYGTQLTQLGNMPKLTTIGEYAFYNTPLTQLGDMSALKTIGDGAFRGTQLTQLGDMRALTDIGDRAFYRCTSLRKICLPNTLRNVNFFAFALCPLDELTVQPGADFVCACDHLARKLQAIRNVSVESIQGGSYRILCN